MVEHSSANPKVPGFDSGPGLIPGSWIMMRHLTPGVVHNFPKAVGDFCPLCTKRSQIPIRKEKGATPGILVSFLNNRW